MVIKNLNMTLRIWILQDTLIGKNTENLIEVLDPALEWI